VPSDSAGSETWFSGQAQQKVQQELPSPKKDELKQGTFGSMVSPFVVILLKDSRLQDTTRKRIQILKGTHYEANKTHV
jgi:hypothetical protein